VSTTAELLARNRGALVRVLAPSLVLAAAGSLLVPDDAGLLGASSGGSGGGEVSIKNPIADLRRDLVLGPDVNLLTVRTDDPDPSYLRISALDDFDGDTWRPSRRELPPRQRADGPLPPPVGLEEGVQQTRYRYDLEGSAVLDSMWLPLPFPATAADAPGDWRYDAETLDVTTTDEGLDTADLAYSATGLQLSPTARQLVEAPAPPAQLADDNTALPFEDTVPEWLDTIVQDLTADADSDFAAAVAMQRWFRNPVNFRYSTARDSGNGLDDLRTFLTPGPEGRVGYCEQFASAMAVMARVAGIPARVAVGFLEPDPLLPGSWLFSAHDLHAWPELYFEGVGWVRFEPTPSGQAATSVPGYTTGQLPQVQEETLPTASASSASPSRPVRTEDPLSSAGTSETNDETSRWWLAPLTLVAVMLLLLVPRLLRSRRRRLRAAVGEAGGGRAAEAAWDELRACVLDLGHSWPDQVTLRGQEQHLVRLGRRAPVGSRVNGSSPPVSSDSMRDAIGVVVDAVERARFSPTPVTEEEGRGAWEAAQRVVRGMGDRSEPGARRRATWWPRSLRAGAPPD
jgi:transglutaminase-like putative cysteine protease